MISALKFQHTAAPSRARKLFRLAALAGAGFAVILSAASGFPEQWLCIADAPQRSDVIIVLGGDARRSSQAAALFHEGWAARILISGAGDWPDYRGQLLEAGVPKEAIEIENNSMSTFENARFSADFLQKHGAKRAILVTSWFHTRRALQTFEKRCPDVFFISVPVYHSRTPRSLGLSSGELALVLREYAKILVYAVWHGVCPVGCLAFVPLRNLSVLSDAPVTTFA